MKEIVKEVNVCFTFNENYIKHASVSIVSMLMNSKPDYNLNIYIVTDGRLSERAENQLRLLCRFRANVEFMFVSADNSTLGKDLMNSDRFPILVYYRLFLTKILPSLSKILYLDSDIAVVGDVKELYDKDMAGRSVGAVMDWNSEGLKQRYGFTQEDFQYCNAGILLLDLDRIREIGLDDKFKECVNTEQERISNLPDQNALNIVMEREREFYYLGHEWNLYYLSIASRTTEDHALYTQAAATPRIIHFLGERKKKPWQKGCKQRHRSVYWEYRKQFDYPSYVWHRLSKILDLFFEYSNDKSSSKTRVRILRLTAFKSVAKDGYKRIYIFGIPIFSSRV